MKDMKVKFNLQCVKVLSSQFSSYLFHDVNFPARHLTFSDGSLAPFCKYRQNSLVFE